MKMDYTYQAWEFSIPMSKMSEQTFWENDAQLDSGLENSFVIFKMHVQVRVGYTHKQIYPWNGQERRGGVAKTLRATFYS